jgi:excinuclease ABC subunit A
METLEATGLGYIHLGQPATTLSGGEAQRIKLASELSRRSTGKTLYVLDEPTTGLSFQDVAHLLDVLQRLADAGNTVVVIEHHLDVIKAADYIIDLGPYGGDRGGELVATGTPEEVAANPNSFTGQYLRPVLEAAGSAPIAAAATKRKAVGRKLAAVGASSRNGASENEETATAAAATIGARLERETAGASQVRPKTKAAEKRERQAANPRKETASEKGLREKRQG